MRPTDLIKARYTGILFIRLNTLVFENNNETAKNDLIITIKRGGGSCL